MCTAWWVGCTNRVCRSSNASFDLGVDLADKAVVLLLVEEVSVTDVLVRVVTGEGLWGHLLIRVAEADVAHVVRVVKQIGVQGVVVPEVVLVVLALPVPVDHVVQETSHTRTDIDPEYWAHKVEPRVHGTHDFVVGVR